MLNRLFVSQIILFDNWQLHDGSVLIFLSYSSTKQENDIRIETGYSADRILPRTDTELMIDKTIEDYFSKQELGDGLASLALNSVQVIYDSTFYENNTINSESDVAITPNPKKSNNYEKNQIVVKEKKKTPFLVKILLFLMAPIIIILSLVKRIFSFGRFGRGVRNNFGPNHMNDYRNDYNYNNNSNRNNNYSYGSNSRSRGESISRTFKNSDESFLRSNRNSTNTNRTTGSASRSSNNSDRSSGSSSRSTSGSSRGGSFGRKF